MPEQIDIVVDLGVLPPPLPEILRLRQLVETAPAAPPQIIGGVLHQGCKMILGGTSKSNKNWCLLDLAVSLCRRAIVMGLLKPDPCCVEAGRGASERKGRR